MRVGSTFSGVGGFDLAAERAGMEVAWQIEIEPVARRVLQKRFPDVQQFNDICEVSNDRLSPIDVLVGGFPCQDLSVAGRRVGLVGERSGLFYEFVRLIGETQPTWVVIENVPGLLSSNGGRDMGTVLGSLAELGYGWAYRVLDAQNWGVPQRRRRVFIVGHRGDWARAAAVLFESEGCHWDTPSRRKTGSDVVFALAASVRGTGDQHDNLWNSTYVPEVAVNSAQGGVAAALSTRQSRLEHEQTYVVASALTASNGRHGHSSPCGDGQDNLVATWDPMNVTSKANRTLVEAGRPSNTLHVNGLSEHGESIDVRRLLPMECERLQGFPVGWTCVADHLQPCDCPDGPRYRQMGNAVAVPVVEWILRRMASIEQSNAEP